MSKTKAAKSDGTWRGVTNGLRVLVLVFTYRGEKIRPITAWDAGKDLKQFYFRTVGKTHG